MFFLNSALLPDKTNFWKRFFLKFYVDKNVAIRLFWKRISNKLRGGYYLFYNNV
jgi:hypothetical protein